MFRCLPLEKTVIWSLPWHWSSHRVMISFFTTSHPTFVLDILLLESICGISFGILSLTHIDTIFDIEHCHRIRSHIFFGILSGICLICFLTYLTYVSACYLTCIVNCLLIFASKYVLTVNLTCCLTYLARIPGCHSWLLPWHLGFDTDSKEFDHLNHPKSHPRHITSWCCIDDSKGPPPLFLGGAFLIRNQKSPIFL